MHPKIMEVCTSLNNIADLINKHGAPYREIPLSQQFGWHHPVITSAEIEQLPRNFVQKLEDANLESLDGLNEKAIEQIPIRLNSNQQQQTITHMFNGHGHQAFPAFKLTLDWIESLFDPILGYGNTKNPLIPNSLKRKIRSAQTQIDNLDIKKDDLERIIQQINSAHAAAESLPTDLEDLKDARVTLTNTVNSAQSNIENAIEKEKTNLLSATGLADSKLSDIDKLLQDVSHRSQLLDEQETVAKKLLEDSEKAYSISVTKGLSGAFHTRARSLSISMWLWVLGLVGALYFGVETGSERIASLTTLMSAETPNINLILIQLFLSILNLGAPIWFAWLSTKQISQRFRLAEDYNYKASVSKAYEGYRKEAARIDPVLEAKLLHSALTRIDEAPLRHIDEQYHSTPWQELIASTEFLDAINSIPALKNRFSDILNKFLPDSLKSMSEK